MMQLRAIANVPGIAISGFGNNGDIERSLQAGFSEHLIKPIKLGNLEAAIERALSQPRADVPLKTTSASKVH
jgi:CheY-like chemotaxis protein